MRFRMDIEMGESFADDDPGELLRIIRNTWHAIKDVGTTQADSGPVDVVDSSGDVVGWWHIEDENL